MANDGPMRQFPRDPLLVEIVVSPGHSYWVKNGEPSMTHEANLVSEAELVTGRGIRGDRYFDKRKNHKGQVTLMTSEAIDEVRRQFDLPDLGAGVFRRNLIVSRISLAELVGHEFQLQGVTLEGTQECTPCRWMDRVVAEGARAFMQHNFRGGLRAKVIHGGVVKVHRFIDE